MAAGPVEFGSTGLFNDASCVAYYKGESTADSKGANTLTNNNSVAFSAGKFNNGFDSGSSYGSKYMRVANALSYTGGAYSISLWVKLNTEIAANTYTFCELADTASDSSLVIDYNYNGGTRQIEVFRLRAGISSGNVQANQTLGTSVFHHLVITYDGTTITGYFDGTSFGTATNSGSGSGLTSGFTILDGRNGPDSTTAALAIVDDVSCFTRVLTAAEVLMLYQGGIAFDAASNSGYQATASSYNWSHTTLAAGDSRYLIVGVSMLSVVGSSVTGITYNSVAMTYLGSIASVSGAVRSELWGLLAPSTGANSIAVTLSTGLISAAGAISFTGVHQTSPTEGVNTASATNVGAADATVNVTTVATNDWVVDQVATDDTAITVGAGQTSRNNVTGAGGSGADSTEPATTAGSYTMSWTSVGALATWSTVAVALRDINASSLASTARLRSLLGVGL